MDYPKISIVTPVLNQVKHVEATIRSILNQNYPNLEYIIIDGGSTDGTLEVIKKYAAQLSYWVSEPDNGMYEAIQKGFEHSTGEIMAWLNADDMYHKGSLFTIAEIFTVYPEVEWLEGANSVWDNHDCGGRAVAVWQGKAFSKYDFFVGDYHWVQQESTAWRRSLWEKTEGLNTQLKYAGDFALWLSFFRHAKLYQTSALVGGFRKWSSHQLSVAHIDKYEEECRSVLQNEEISKEDILILKRYNKIRKINKIIAKLRIRLDLETRYKKKYFGYPPRIYYSMDEGRFIKIWIQPI
jgi:glycosyltransferase involved in cell wall biosynthesis